MSSHLKKLGLSDTKFELKYHTPKCSRQQQRPPSSAKPHSNPTQTNTVLSVLIELINRKQRETCSLQGHDRNPIKFLCLEENCPIRAGCSYCFLDGHKGHSKIESRVCLKDLVQLQQRTQISRSLLKSQLQIRKQQLLGKIDAEVSNIKEEFLSSLDYMNRKVRQSIQARFNEAMTQFNCPRQIDPQFAAFKEKDDMQLDASQPSDDANDIISKFMLSSTSKQPQTKPSIRSISKYPLKRDSASLSSLSREDEHQLLVKLSRLNLTYVEEYLKHETAHLKQFMGGLKMYEEYYTELNSSLSQFFAAFKRAVPSLKTLDVGLQQPEVLQVFPHRC